MTYKFDDYPEYARMDGFGMPIDVSYGNVLLGVIATEPDGYILVKVLTPKSERRFALSTNNNFKTKNQAAEVLHRAWKKERYGGDDSGVGVPA